MILQLFKKSLIAVIALGIIIPSLDNTVFAMDAGPEGASEAVAGASKAGTAAALTGALTPFVFACMPAPEGALTLVHSIPSNPLTGSGLCAQNVAIAANQAAKEAADAAAKNLTFLQRLANFAAKIAYILLKKVILDKLVDALVLWINNDGKGAIIENWDQFFADAGQNAVGTFAQGLGAGFLCKPFNLQMQVILLPVDTFSTVSCTLNDIIGNIDSFLGDFRNGSWLAYQETWYPRNNFYGGAIIAMDAAASGAAAARDAAANEAAAGQGFMSFTKDDYFISSTGPYKDKNGTFAEPGYTGIRYVKEKRTVTPGSVAAQAVTESLFTIPGNRLIHADDMTVYITAVLNASINKLTKLGITGIKSLVGKNTPTLERIDARNPCGGLTGDSFRACLASVNAESRDIRNTQDGVINTTTSSLATRVEVANTLNQAITLQSQLVDTLTILTTGNPESSLLPELAAEQSILDDLQNSLADNQTFVDAMLAQIEQINSSSSPTPNTAVTAEDWASLSNSASTTFVDDIQAASGSLTAAENDLRAITDKVNSRMPALEAQLPSTTTPAVIP